MDAKRDFVGEDLLRKTRKVDKVNSCERGRGKLVKQMRERIPEKEGQSKNK